MQQREDLLQEYIRRVLEIQDQRTTDLQPADLEAVSRELGLEDHEVQALRQRFEAHYQRGIGYMRYQRWSDAVEEFRLATALNPLHTQALYQLALAHKNRWLYAARSEDRNEAEALAKRCLALEPRHQASYELLSDLERHTVSVPVPMEPDRYEKTAYIISFVVFLVLLVGVVWWLLV